ncbi:MAG: type II toxin-antitoxin system RelE/ParE family toxin [Candidatus Thiodiazotropha lotti]|nr:type II toxin-antitoxin system RelE/ParE family toxin [Candidatus Thiodiazotropha lotti]
MKVRLSKPTRAGLDEIWRYTKENWGVNQADRNIDALTMRLRWLTKNKPLWMSRDELNRGLFSFREGRYVIFFKASKQSISIIRILNDRMDVSLRLAG